MTTELNQCFTAWYHEPKYGKFGVLPYPLAVEGYFAEYATPEFEHYGELRDNPNFWCQWNYDFGQFTVQLKNWHETVEVTKTHTAAVARLAWDVYSAAVDEHYKDVNGKWW